MSSPLADQILTQFRQATTADDINLIASKYRAEVQQMKGADPPRYHHLVNAKAYYLKGLKDGRPHHQNSR